MGGHNQREYERYVSTISSFSLALVRCAGVNGTGPQVVGDTIT
jgi:hypothetical protein